MTPNQREQVNQVKTRIQNMRAGGSRDEFIQAGLMDEGWAAAAIVAAFEELGER